MRGARFATPYLEISRAPSVSMIDVNFAMTGDLRRNARALRQIGTLAESGMSVCVFSFGSRPPGMASSIDHVEVTKPSGGGASFFFAAHRGFSLALKNREARLFHASDLYVLSAVSRAALEAGSPCTYDSRELYPHVAATAGRPHIRAFWGFLERLSIKRTSAVWTVSDGIADRLQRRYGIDRPFVQHNAPAMRSVEPSRFLREQTGWPEDRPLLVHAGQMRAGRGGEALIGAMRAVPDAGLVFLGYGPHQSVLEELVDAHDLRSRVAFLQPVPVDEVLDVLAGADAGVTFLEDSCLNHRLALPNKLFDYLAASLPILASDLPEMSRLLSLYNAGLSVDPTDYRKTAEAIRRLLFDQSARAIWKEGAVKAAETFDWRSASEQFLLQMNSALSA